MSLRQMLRERLGCLKQIVLLKNNDTVRMSRLFHAHMWCRNVG